LYRKFLHSYPPYLLLGSANPICRVWVSSIFVIGDSDMRKMELGRGISVRAVVQIQSPIIF
jgi:hypothetical protein